MKSNTSKLFVFIVLLIIAAIAIVLIAQYKFNLPGNAPSSSTMTTTSSSQNSSKYAQMFCLDASNNASAMRIAVTNGIMCFRADITLNSGEAKFVSNVSSAGARYLGILDYDTVGAQPSRYGCASGCNWTLNTWNASVANAVADYPSIKEWEIYNEPLIGEFISGYENGSALHYFNMIKSAYTIIKSREPNATIVCFGGAGIFPGSTVQVEYAFYKQVWAYGASKYCDAVSLHAYSQPYSNFSQPVASGYTLAQVYNYTINLYENLTNKPIWVTETGIPSNSTVGVSEQEQASYLTQDFNFFVSYPFVKRIYWFHLFGENGRGEDYGLLNTSTLQPKPAWLSFIAFLHNGSG